MTPTKPWSSCWYAAWVRTSTWLGSTVMCGWLWYLRKGTHAGGGAAALEGLRTRAYEQHPRIFTMPMHAGKRASVRLPCPSSYTQYIEPSSQARSPIPSAMRMRRQHAAIIISYLGELVAALAEVVCSIIAGGSLSRTSQ